MAIVMGAALAAADTIDGGAGTDTVTLKGDYSAGLVFGAATMVNVETLQLLGSGSYKLKTSDATVAANAVLTVALAATTRTWPWRSARAHLANLKDTAFV